MGPEGIALMRRIKRCWTRTACSIPASSSDDPKAHLAHLKPMPASDAIVDPCIEVRLLRGSAVAPCRSRRASACRAPIGSCRRGRSGEVAGILPAVLAIRASTPAPPPGLCADRCRWASTPSAHRSCALTSTSASCPSPAGAPIISPALPAARGASVKAIAGKVLGRQRRWQDW